ncbi:hypothetical protein [Chamaesiphon minutus]|uniref:hypothetical protein n=1 Tax=Chamaesiphon minutus TaxID=1173032 RepID=UPI0005A2B76C|nr:hypothetical protein [Chamaesiphon minutus]
MKKLDRSPEDAIVSIDDWYALPSVLKSRLKLYVGCLDRNLTVFVPTGIDSYGATGNRSCYL